MVCVVHIQEDVCKHLMNLGEDRGAGFMGDNVQQPGPNEQDRRGQGQGGGDACQVTTPRSPPNHALSYFTHLQEMVQIGP